MSRSFLLLGEKKKERIRITGIFILSTLMETTSKHSLLKMLIIRYPYLLGETILPIHIPL